MSKPNIIITNYDELHNPYYAGGGALAMHEIAKRLSKTHEVTYIAGSYVGAKERTEDGVIYKHIGLSVGPRLGQVAYLLSLPFVIARQKADVILENFLPPHSTMMLPLISRVPVIGITTLLDAHYFSEKYHLPFALIEHLGLKTYRNIIALSEDIAHRVRMVNSNCNIHVIPNGISSHLLKKKSIEKGYVCFLGRIDRYQKGLDILLDAWEIAAPKFPKLTLVIIGDGPTYEVDWLRNRIAQSPVASSIVYKGKVIGVAKDTLLAEAVAVLAPSRFESFGIAVLEAMALGKVVVRFDIPGFRWIPQHTTSIAPVLTAHSYADTMISILISQKQRKTIGIKSRAFAKQFTWDEIAKQYEHFIESVKKKSI